MKVLLDECVTHDLRELLVGHEVFTVAFLGWSGIKNGRLLSLAAGQGFDALISTDTGLPHQHNESTLALPVIILHAGSSRIQDISPLVPECLILLSGTLAHQFHRVGQR